MSWQTQLNELGLVGLAGLMGMLMGLEREFARKPAGLRTHILVAAGAAVLVLVGPAVVETYRTSVPPESLRVDPIHVIQAIVIGIGFLGAGTIVRLRGERVEGLTTAASVLFTACIGVTVAARQIVLAAGCCVGGLVVLRVVGALEGRLERKLDLDRYSLPKDSERRAGKHSDSSGRSGPR
jgi:putative Mg2+ transporter-C (MgtC) family protein